MSDMYFDNKDRGGASWCSPRYDTTGSNKIIEFDSSGLSPTNETIEVVPKSQLTQERENRKRDLQEVLEYFENNNDEAFRKHLESKLSDLKKG